MFKLKLFVVTLILAPTTVFGAMWCSNWVEVPERPCPEDGLYDSFDERKKCEMESEALKLAEWKRVGEQIKELEKQLPICATLWTPEATCRKILDSNITTLENY